MTSPPVHSYIHLAERLLPPSTYLKAAVCGESLLGQVLARAVQVEHVAATIAALRASASISEDYSDLCPNNFVISDGAGQIVFTGPIEQLTEVLKLQKRKEAKQRDIDFWLRVMNRHRAFSVWGLGNEPLTEIPSLAAVTRKKDIGYSRCAFPRVEPDYLRRVEPKATPYDSAWDELRRKTLQERFTGLTNWCPACKRYVADGHDGPQGISCADYLGKMAEKEAQQAAKEARKRAEWCAKATERRREKMETLRQAREYVYSPEDFDRDILSSRGSVNAEIVKQFDRDQSRKGNKYRVR